MPQSPPQKKSIDYPAFHREGRAIHPWCLPGADLAMRIMPPAIATRELQAFSMFCFLSTQSSSDMNQLTNLIIDKTKAPGVKASPIESIVWGKITGLVHNSRPKKDLQLQ